MELSIRVDEQLTITGENGEWWYGIAHGEEGWFPSSYVRVE